MKRFALIAALVLAVPIGFAAASDAGPTISAATAPVVVPDAGPALAAPAVVAAPVAPVATADAPPSLDSPLPFIKIMFLNVKNGNWWGAAAALLVLVVGLLRTYGKKIHEKLPDNLLWDKPFWFLFDTKPGGVLLNVLTAVGGGMGTALLAGEPVTWALVKPILMVAATGSALWEIGKDLFEWIKAKGVPKPPDPAPTKP